MWRDVWRGIAGLSTGTDCSRASRSPRRFPASSSLVLYSIVAASLVVSAEEVAASSEVASSFFWAIGLSYLRFFCWFSVENRLLPVAAVVLLLLVWTLAWQLQGIRCSIRFWSFWIYRSFTAMEADNCSRICSICWSRSITVSINWPIYCFTSFSFSTMLLLLKFWSDVAQLLMS